MTSSLKKRAKTLAERSGCSYQKAWQELTLHRSAPPPEIANSTGTDRQVRYVRVYCDYEVSNRAGAYGTWQVEALEEEVNGATEDVTRLVDHGIHFHDISELKRYLEREHPEFEFELEEGS